MLRACRLAFVLALLPRVVVAEQIIFASNEDGPWRIWSIQPDGSAMKPLTKGDGDYHDVDPVFSPDGKRILFTSTRGGKSGVWRMQADGSEPVRICDGDQAHWAPDVRSIVFRRGGSIRTRDLATGEEKIIVPRDWPHCSGPAWSPDGRRIAFAARWDAGNAIYLVPAKGGQPVKVYDKKGACEPQWSPDGSKLVYETETHICTIRPDGTKNRLVTYFGGVQRYGRFSPDGQHVVFCQAPSPRGPWELYIIPSAGGPPRKLTDEGSHIHPDWH